MFVDLDWPLNASSLLSASAELLVIIPIMYCKFSCMQQNSALLVANPLMSGSQTCRETIRKFITWVELEPKMEVFQYPPACRESFYCKPIILLMESMSEWVPFGGLTHQISTTPNGEVQTWKKFSFRKFISSIPCNVDINSLNSTVKSYFYNLSKSGKDIARKFCE